MNMFNLVTVTIYSRIGKMSLYYCEYSDKFEYLKETDKLDMLIFLLSFSRFVLLLKLFFFELLFLSKFMLLLFKYCHSVYLNEYSYRYKKEFLIVVSIHLLWSLLIYPYF